MNIIVLGAGAIGCYVGGRLAAAGEHVTLVGRPKTTEPLALGGLTVTDLDGFKAHVAADLTSQNLSVASSLKLAQTNRLAKKPETKSTHNASANENTVVLLCVKGGATMSAAQEIAEYCPAGTSVVSLQNGVDNVARIKSAAPQMQAFAGMVPYNVVMKTATHVHRTTMGQIYLEQSNTSTNTSTNASINASTNISTNTSSVTQEVAAIFNAAGLNTVLSTDMRTVQWSKLLLNVNNPVNALSDLPLREQLLNRDFRYVLATLQLEVLAVMCAAGITPMQLAAAPPKLLPHLLKLPNVLFTRIAKKMLRVDISARSSMWDDVQHARTTEIDDMCGAVVRLAAQVGIVAPCNEAICKLINTHTKGHRWTGSELRKALGI
jgi:2-dehydropantoate 2-reductase